MNQVRQEAITTEISEIVSGAEALSGDDEEATIELILANNPTASIR
jgi:hypothetical protein